MRLHERHLLSDALVELGQYDDAVSSLENANDISPDLRVYARGSYLRWLDGDQEGAIELMVDAIKMGSQTNEAVAWCYVELGMLFWHANQLDEAAKAAARASDLVPGYAGATELEARIAATEGKRDEAIKLYEQLVSRKPTVAAYIALSELQQKQGNTAETETQRAFAEEMAVHDPLALALHDARYGLNPAQTLLMAEKAVKERSNIYTRDAHALALLRAGKVAEARIACGDDGPLAASMPHSGCTAGLCKPPTETPRQPKSPSTERSDLTRGLTHGSSQNLNLSSQRDNCYEPHLFRDTRSPVLVPVHNH